MSGNDHYTVDQEIFAEEIFKCLIFDVQRKNFARYTHRKIFARYIFAANTTDEKVNGKKFPDLRYVH